MRTAGQIIGKAFGNQIGLRVNLDPRPQGILKHLVHQRVMRAAQNCRLGVRHPATQRLDMGPHQRLGQHLVALLDRVDYTATGLGLDIDTDRPERKFTLERAACNSGGGGEQRHMLDRNLTRGGIVPPLPFGQRLDQRDKDAQHPLFRRHPAFLHPLQRRSACGVAGQDHQIAAFRPKPFRGRTGQVEDVVGSPHTVRRMRVVAQIDQRHLWQAAGHRIQHRQPAKPRIENADRHALSPVAHSDCAMCRFAKA